MKYCRISLLLLIVVSTFVDAGRRSKRDDNKSDCTPEQDKLIDACDPKYKIVDDLLNKQNMVTDTKDDFEKVAKACFEEVECMKPVTCPSERKIIDEQTHLTCLMNECNAKLVGLKDSVPCLKEYIFVKSKEMAGPTPEECARWKIHGTCISDIIKKECGAAISKAFQEGIKDIKC